MSRATDMIAAERERQITEEGYAPERDAGKALDLSRAAQSYTGYALRTQHSGTPTDRQVPIMWPWAARYWKPTGDPVRDLVKAGALIAAAIDSLTAGATDSP